MERLEFGLLHSQDLLEAQQLYHDHAGGYLPVPDVENLYNLTLDQALFGVWAEDSQLVAVAGRFPLTRATWPDSARIIAVYELAGMVIDPGRIGGLRPVSIQDILVALRTFTLWDEQATNVCLISSVADKNKNSSGALVRSGLFEVEDPPQWLIDIRRTWLAGERPEVIDFIVTEQTVRRLRNMFINARTELTHRTHRATQKLQEFSFFFRPELGTHDMGARVTYRDLAWEKAIPSVRLLGTEPPYMRWPPVVARG